MLWNFWRFNSNKNQKQFVFNGSLYLSNLRECVRKRFLSLFIYTFCLLDTNLLPSVTPFFATRMCQDCPSFMPTLTVHSKPHPPPPIFLPSLYFFLCFSPPLSLTHTQGYLTTKLYNLHSGISSGKVHP